MRQGVSLVRWISAGSAALALAIGVASLPAGLTQAQATTAYQVYATGAGSFEGAEILDITPDNRYGLVVGVQSSERKVRVAVINPVTGLRKIDPGNDDLTAQVTNLGLERPSTSAVAVYPGTDQRYAIVTIRECKVDEGSAATCTAPTTVKNGGAVFINVNEDGTVGAARSTALPLGLEPEHIEIAPSGDYAVVANEGRAGSGGSISIIDLRGGAATANVVFTIDQATLGPNTAPEAVAISPDSGRAFVSLQTTNQVAVIDINQATLTPTTEVVTLGSSPAGAPLRPDGLAVTPDSNYLVTANEGISGARTNTVSLFRINPNDNDAATPRLSLVGDSGSSIAGDDNPEMVDVGLVGGQVKAFVTLSGSHAVAVFNVTPGGLVFEQRIDLTRGGALNVRGPEGIKIASGANLPANTSLIVTANQVSRNVSVIQATTEATPTPTTPPADGDTIYLPLVTR